MRRSLVIGLAGLLLLTGACGDGGGPAGGGGVDLDDGDLGGATLAGLGDGASPVDLTSYRGRPLVLNFFASTCAPCVREMPALEDAHQAAAGEVAILGVAVNDRVADALELTERTGVTYDLAADPRGDYFTESGASLLPTTLVFDADGELVRRLTGEITAAELVEVLAEETGVEVILA